jgi:hypothetical protein
MTRCPFCTQDPYHYVDNGVGMEAVAVTCCDLGCAVYDHRNDDDAEITITSKELREIAGQIAAQRWQMERRDRLIERLWKRRALGGNPS